MKKKANKATRKFAAKGQLKKTIQTRQKHQQFKKKVQGRRGKGFGRRTENVEGGEEEDSLNGAQKAPNSKPTVDDILDANFMENDGSSEIEDDAPLSEEEDDEGDVADDQSFASVDDLEDEAEAHLLELSKLAEKDPEFYKYLQENDRELLEFDPNAIDTAEAPDDCDDDDSLGMDQDGYEEDAMPSTPVLTKEELIRWQKALLQQRSLRALRKLLLAFRSAVHMHEENQDLAWRIDSSSVYNKLVTTALKYTPVVLEHHVPYKNLPNGRFKPPTQTPKLTTIQKLIQSYFHNVIHILDQLTDDDMIEVAVTESAKIVPWVISSRRAVKLYLKKCLELWSSGSDCVRIAAFLAIRKLASANDDSMLDQVLKKTYLTLVRSCKSTTAHTLPSINLLKNSATEVFCIDHSLAYQHAFGYIRQLAIHLRESMKAKTKEAYKQVYNWQFVHCIDFWTIVLARACGGEVMGQESELKSLIYPLVQVSLGAIRLVSNTRVFPFHLHILRSLLHLTRHTLVYVPLASYILPIVTAVLAPSAQGKTSTLRPLDLDVVIRGPQQYLKTRIYCEVLVEEAAYVLAEWLSGPTVQGSIALPEVVVGVVVVLRKALKTAKVAGTGGKVAGAIKALVEKVEESARWVEGKRQGVQFAPGKFEAVQDWEAAMRGRLGESPLGKHVKILRVTRERRKALVEKARQGEVEVLED